MHEKKWDTPTPQSINIHKLGVEIMLLREQVNIQNKRIHELAERNMVLEERMKIVKRVYRMPIKEFIMSAFKFDRIELRTSRVKKGGTRNDSKTI